MDQERIDRILTLASKEKTASWAAMGKITGRPVNALRDALGTVFLGSKATKGVMKGKRMHSVGMKNIGPDEYHKLWRQQGEKGIPGVVSTKTPSGKKIYQKEHYRPGGLVGAAMKHPLITAGLGGAAYMVGTAPRPQKQVTNNYYAQQQQQSQNQNWG